MAQEFVIFFELILIWFSPKICYFLIVPNTKPSKEKKSIFSIVWQEISYTEGNQGELLQIKSNGATSMWTAKPPGAVEQKAAFHTTPSARMSGRMRCQQLHHVYTRHFHEGTQRRGEP
jgi:hypothetical protein